MAIPMKTRPIDAECLPHQVHNQDVRLFTRLMPDTDWLAVPCFICGASLGKKCELSTGQLRNAPHTERRLHAAAETEAQ